MTLSQVQSFYYWDWRKKKRGLGWGSQWRELNPSDEDSEEGSLKSRQGWETIRDVASWLGLFCSIQTDWDVIPSKKKKFTQPVRVWINSTCAMKPVRETHEGPFCRQEQSELQTKRGFHWKWLLGLFLYVLWAQTASKKRIKKREEKLSWSQSHK